MTPFDWVCMASMYNTTITDMNVAQNLTLPLKTLCALLDKLSKVETETSSHLRDKNYQCKFLLSILAFTITDTGLPAQSSGQTQSWEHHCKAIYLGSKIQTMINDQSYKMVSHVTHLVVAWVTDHNVIHHIHTPSPCFLCIRAPFACLTAVSEIGVCARFSHKKIRKYRNSWPQSPARI